MLSVLQYWQHWQQRKCKEVHAVPAVLHSLVGSWCVGGRTGITVQHNINAADWEVPEEQDGSQHQFPPDMLILVKAVWLTISGCILGSSPLSGAQCHHSIMCCWYEKSWLFGVNTTTHPTNTYYIHTSPGHSSLMIIVLLVIKYYDTSYSTCLMIW